MTEVKFKEYVSIQRSGKTNMFLINNVIMLSGGILDRDDCMDIIKNYKKYYEKYVQLERKRL